VRITRPFYLGVHEVTRGQFRRFVDDSGYQTEAEKDGKGGYGWNEDAKKFGQNPRYTWREAGFEQTDLHPVVNVSWNDAVAFAKWLGRKEGKTYRLPTEAEWEYACRAGTMTRYFPGDDAEALAEVGNVADATTREKHPDWTWTIAARDGFVYTAPVGRYHPNAWGLHDMHGNVWEWCWDWYEKDFYKGSRVTTQPTRSRPRTG
jgi:formylglycine-generating enzyme required for sulfatase activity